MALLLDLNNFIYQNGRATVRKRRRSSKHWFIPETHTELGLHQAAAREVELHPCPQRGWQRPKYLTHHLLPPTVCH